MMPKVLSPGNSSAGLADFSLLADMPVALDSCRTLEVEMILHSPAVDDVAAALRTSADEIAIVLNAVDENSVVTAAGLIFGARRVFLGGAGRSGIAMRMVAMRFMHLGLDAHVLGEATTPAIAEDDVVVLASGSGNTESTAMVARKSKEAGAKVIAMTAAADGRVSLLADFRIQIAAAGKQAGDRSATAQYAGSLFEQTVVLLFDAMFHATWRSNRVPTEILWARHANWE